MTALMAPAEMAAACRAAVERKKAGRRVEYRSYTVQEERQAWLEGRELERVSIYAPEWRDPENLAEFLDDRVIEWGHAQGSPEAPVMIAVAEAARESTAAAVRALKAARALPPEVAWNVYRNLDRWRALDEAGRMGVGPLVAALSAEWRRLKLPAEDPALAEAKRQRPTGRGLFGIVEAAS